MIGISYYKKFFHLMRRNVIRTLTLLLLGCGVFLLLSDQNTSHQLLVSSPKLESNCHGTPSSWQMKSIENWTLEEMLDYIKWDNRSACTLAYDFGGTVERAIGLHGEKTVCLDENVRPNWSKVGRRFPFLLIKSDDCLVYSFGINNEWTFDEAMESFGCRVFSFDPSMNKGPHNHSEKIHFYDIGLGDSDDVSHIKRNTQNWTIMSLDSIYKNLLKHQGKIIDYLKIDIEESEWAALPQILSSGMMDNVRQLGVEVHLFSDQDNCELEYVRKQIKIVKSLEDYGLVRFDSQLNPWSLEWTFIDNVKWQGYSCYEIAWYNSKLARY